MVLAEFSTWVGPAVIGWLVLMLIAIIAGWMKRPSNHRATSDKRQPAGVRHEAIASNALGRSPEVKQQPADVAREVSDVEHQAAMRDFGVSERIGDELRMGWFEHIFVLGTPIAGVDEVWTLHGFAHFSTGRRCIALEDGQRLVILDRERDHGVRLEIPKSQWFDASVTGSRIVLSCYKQHGGRKLAGRFVIEMHTDHNTALVPEDWPWKFTLYPETGASPHER